MSKSLAECANKAHSAWNEFIDSRVGWRNKAYAGAHWVIAYPPHHWRNDSSTLHIKKVAVLVGWLFRCSDRARYSDANPPYQDIVFLCKGIDL